MTRPDRPPGREREGGPPITIPTGRPVNTPETTPPPGREIMLRSVPRGSGRNAARRRTDDEQFAEMHARLIAAHGRRAGSDPAALAALWRLRGEVDRALAFAVDQLRANGFSWAQIATETGLTRQGLCQWRGRASRDFSVNGPVQPEPGGDGAPW